MGVVSSKNEPILPPLPIPDVIIHFLLENKRADFADILQDVEQYCLFAKPNLDAASASMQLPETFVATYTEDSLEQQVNKMNYICPLPLRMLSI